MASKKINRPVVATIQPKKRLKKIATKKKVKTKSQKKTSRAQTKHVPVKHTPKKHSQSSKQSLSNGENIEIQEPIIAITLPRTENTPQQYIQYISLTEYFLSVAFIMLLFVSGIFVTLRTRTLPSSRIVTPTMGQVSHTIAQLVLR